MGNDFEREFDDEVYEDEFYDEHFDEEELIDDDLKDDDKELEAGAEELVDEEAVEAAEDEEVEWDEDKERRVDVSYACEDCDYRWEDVIIKKKDRLEDDEEIDVVCPMCGSINITQI